MINVIRLHGDPHKQVQDLLPWYANGTLEPQDVATVEAHLADCPQCRAELEYERTLGREIAGLDAERGWATLRGRIEGEPSGATPKRWLRPQTVLRRRIPLGWALAAQAAALAVVVLAAVALNAPNRAAYRTLGAPAGAVSGNVVVMFRPTTSERQLRDALTSSGARLVDGPTASDAYVLHVASERRTTALAKLRSNPQVTLAEAIEGDSRP